ncbi:MAG: hypothetical protein K8H89_00935 [Flavobacteriales bacterium]|nr:hypothetical protein [Flavobacteriales bacterium]MCB0758449.1 hypothetical protein [Flavobacteriales bacterium]
MNRFRALLIPALLSLPAALMARDQGPEVLNTDDGRTITIYQPQPESYTDGTSTEGEHPPGGPDLGYKRTERWLADGSSAGIPGDGKAQPSNAMAHAGAAIKLLLPGSDGRYPNGITEPHCGVRNTNIRIGPSTFL